MKRRICLLGGVLCLFFLYIFIQNSSGRKENVSLGRVTEREISGDSSNETLPDRLSDADLPSREAVECRDGDKQPAAGLLSGEATEFRDAGKQPAAVLSSGEEAEFRDAGKQPAAVLSSGEAMEVWEEKPAYVKAYTEFLLSTEIDPGHDFPIRGYYLFDLNFDEIPELGILHDSWGSMGGYFTCYYFDGNGITAVLNDRGEPAGFSDYTQILADFEHKRVYLLKEMYLLQGNENGTYGYVREIKSEGQSPCVYDVLNLEVDQESNLSSHFGTQYAGEDDFLSDPGLEDCLITQHYMEEEWIDISMDEYLQLKRELIPEDNSYVDLREGDLNYLGANYDNNGDFLYTDVRMEKEEIEQLFHRFAQSLE